MWNWQVEHVNFSTIKLVNFTPALPRCGTLKQHYLGESRVEQSGVQKLTENTIPSPNIELTLVQRLRRWPNVKPTLCQSLVLTRDGLVYGGNIFFCLFCNVALARVRLFSRIHRRVVVRKTATTFAVGPPSSSSQHPPPPPPREYELVGLMLTNRLRRWPNIKPTLIQSSLDRGTCLVPTPFHFHRDTRVQVISPLIYLGA